LNNNLLKNIKFAFIFGYKVSEVLIVTKDDKCYGFGQNEYGVLGFGHDNQVKEPEIIEKLCHKKIVNFANGLRHAMALTSDGKVFSWGENECGFLGNGNRNCDLDKPKLNEYLLKEVIVDISCGAFHTIALTKNSEVYVWGSNICGQIGNGSEEFFQLIPIKLNDFRHQKIIAISCGYNHSMVLTESGHVYSWGNNQFGQLGLEGNEEKYNSLKLRSIKINKPKLITFKSENYTNILIEKISCGQNHSLVLSRDGDIFAFGCNKWGQIGYKDFSNSLTPQKLYSSNK
jgi:alpha-tubulin suppressor-like RCC1 family protein